jgi:hypothetical protein
MVISDDPVEGIRALLEVLRAEDRSVWSGAAQMDRAVQLLQVMGEGEAEAARAVGTVAASGAWMADGSRSVGP